MPSPRLQFPIRWLMIAVAVAAVVLALPHPVLEFAACFGAIPAIMVAAGVLVAPRRRRIVVAAWVATLHPLLILVWLMLARSIWYRQPLLPNDHSVLLRWTLEIPYVAVIVANLLIFPALFLGGLIGVVTMMARYPGDRVQLFAEPLILTIGSPLVCTFDWVILGWDPFRLSGWIWD